MRYVTVHDTNVKLYVLCNKPLFCVVIASDVIAVILELCERDIKELLLSTYFTG